LRLLGPCDESASIEELLYEQLKTTLLAVIEARRTCRDIRLRYGDAVHRAETSRLRLRELLGREDFLS
jgi:outer membrane protein TolC